MNLHVLSVHEEKKPFDSEICDYSWSEDGSLNKHFTKQWGTLLRYQVMRRKKYDIKYPTNSIMILDHVQPKIL